MKSILPSEMIFYYDDRYGSRESRYVFHKIIRTREGRLSMKQEFWGDYTGILVDKFGVNWPVNYTLPK